MLLILTRSCASFGRNLVGGWRSSTVIVFVWLDFSGRFCKEMLNSKLKGKLKNHSFLEIRYPESFLVTSVKLNVLVLAETSILQNFCKTPFKWKRNIFREWIHQNVLANFFFQREILLFPRNWFPSQWGHILSIRNSPVSHWRQLF